MKLTRTIRNPGRLKKSSATMLAILLFLAATPHGRAQSATAAPASALLTFDVVSVKPSQPGAEARMKLLSDGLQLRNITLEDFIRQAYGLDFHGQLSGAPGWTRSEHYDIDAKVAGPDAAAFQKLGLREVRLMAQPILAERFKLAAHAEQRVLPIFLLVPSGGGAKLKPATPGDVYTGGIKTAQGAPATNTIGMGRTQNADGTVTNQMTGQAVVISRLVSTLAQLGQDRPIVDRTGLTGTYDFKLSWTTDMTATPGASSTNDAPPSLFTAIQEQLGLKLEPEKESMTVLIVDHVERPSSN